MSQRSCCGMENINQEEESSRVESCWSVVATADFACWTKAGWGRHGKLIREGENKGPEGPNGPVNQWGGGTSDWRAWQVFVPAEVPTADDHFAYK